MKIVVNQKVIVNLIWIAIFICTFLFTGWLPFFFSISGFDVVLYHISCLLFLIIIIWTVNTIFRIKTQVFTIVAIVIAVPIFLISFFGNFMCGYSDNIILKSGEKEKVIVARSYGCGATDSDFPDYRYYERTLLLGALNYYEKVDTALLDKSQWKTVN